MNNSLSLIRDPFSSISHLIGAILAIALMIAMLVNTPSQQAELYQISYISFGLSAFFMFAASAVYHFPNGSLALIQHLKRIDHIAIYVMIAGSYTPYLLIGLNSELGINLLAMIWAIALAGTLKKIFWLRAPRWLSTILYLAMGWVSILIYDDLSQNLSEPALFWLIAGGVIYSLGALIYGFKWPNLHRQFGFHELWHLFVLGGATCHAISIAVYL